MKWEITLQVDEEAHAIRQVFWIGAWKEWIFTTHLQTTPYVYISFVLFLLRSSVYLSQSSRSQTPALIKLSAIAALIWKPKSQNHRRKAGWGLLHELFTAVPVTSCDKVCEGCHDTSPPQKRGKKKIKGKKENKKKDPETKSASFYWLFRKSLKQAN